ncbi:MAG: glycosyltransferase [Candidatus Staskawiczbacteria bacterium]|nr:glycosyltransferase [Candidatus Staskawiczbacteria bacterium]
MAKKILFFLKEYDNYSPIFSEYLAIFSKDDFETNVFDFTKAYGAGNKLAYISSVIKELKRFQPDVIYIGDEFFSKNVLLLVFLEKIFFFRYKILALIASQYVPKSGFLNNTKVKFLLRNINILFCRNDEEFKKIKKTSAFKNYRGLVRMYLGVPEKFFYHIEQPLKKICEQLPTLKDNYPKLKGKYVLGFAGRLVPEKGLLILLECLKKMPEDFVLLLARRIDTNYQDYCAKIDDFINGNNLMRRVIWIDDLDNNDIKYLYNAVDLMVMPTTAKYDGFLELFGSVIAESMLCQTLVIGSDNGSIPEVIDNPHFIFKQDDVKDMLRVIQFVYNLNTKEKEAVVLDNYQKAVKNYSSTVFADTIIRAVNSII